MAKFTTRMQVSAGGVAYRRQGERLEVALILVGRDGKERWQLPKGLVEADEAPEAAALREVREEAGIETELVELLETIEYWYVSKSRGQLVRFHKFVHFYLLTYLRGETSAHDHEVNEARWVEIGTAIQWLAFENEQKVVAKARARLIEEL